MREALLWKRLAEVPLAQPADAVKLLYQSRFGCGHMLPETKRLTDELRRERDAVAEDPSTPAFTPLGNRLCRLNLASPALRRLPPERVAAAMRLSAGEIPPLGENDKRLSLFEEDLRLLHRAAEEGRTGFSPQELADYLHVYRAQGYPPARHSPRYRAAYAPAYRVTLLDFAVLLPLLQLVEERLSAGLPALVVLDGPCGSGKSTLAKRLQGLYGAPAAHMDEFFLPPALRTPARLKEAGGNLHYERFAEECLEGLCRGDEFVYHSYDCRDGESRPIRFPQAAVRIVEGSYALHPRFLPAYETAGALLAFVDVSPRERLQRLQRRDPALFDRFEKLWIPLENSYFQAYDTQRRAQCILHSLSWEGDA